MFQFFSFNTQYGIVGVPTLVIFHNGKPVAKFNDTVYTLETFSKFITHLTNQQPNGSVYVTSADFSGPVSSVPSNETDYCLVLSWIFIAACSLYFTSKSHWWRQFVELVQNTWRESNAQHEHVDWKPKKLFLFLAIYALFLIEKQKLFLISFKKFKFLEKWLIFNCKEKRFVI